MAAEKKRLETTQQKIAKSEASTTQVMLDLQAEEVQQRLALELARIGSENESRRKKLEAKQEEQKTLDQIHAAELSREKAKADMELSLAQEHLAQRVSELRAETDAVVKKAEAVSPQLIAALQDFSDRALAEKMAESMSPLAILGGKSIAEVFSSLLKGTVLENVLHPQLPVPEAEKSRKV